MAVVLTGKLVAIKALEFVGAIAPYDIGVPAEYMRPALETLDLLLPEIHEEYPLAFFRVAETIVPVLAGVSIYNLFTSMSPSNSPRLAMVEAAFLRTYSDPTNPLLYSQHEIKVEALEEFQTGQVMAPMTGRPGAVFVSRSDTAPKLVIDRVPQAPVVLPPPAPAPSLTTNFALMLRGYGIPAETQRNGGGQQLGFPLGWGLFLAYKLATVIGDGPVVKLSVGQLQSLQQSATDRWNRLLGRSARDNQTPSDDVVQFCD